AGRPGGDARPDPSHQDAPALVELLVVELTATVPEFADGDRLEESFLGAHPVERPLLRGRRGQADGEGVEAPARALGLGRRAVPLPTPDRPAHGRASHLDPLLRAGERALEAADPELPGAMEEVEVALAVVRLGRGLRRRLGPRPAGRRGESENHREYENRRGRAHEGTVVDRNGPGQ